MAEVRCLRGEPIHRTPAEAFVALRQYEEESGYEASIMLCPHGRHFHLKYDGGLAKKVAHSTKRVLMTERLAKKKQKELRGKGQRSIQYYECWYSNPESGPHFHMGNPPGFQTYARPFDILRRT